MIRTLVALSLLSCLTLALEVDLLFLFALTRDEIDPDTQETVRITEAGNTQAYVTSAALVNLLNEGTRPLTDFDYGCDNVTLKYSLVDTRANFSYTLSEFVEPSTDLRKFSVIIGPSRSTTCIPVSFASSPFQIPIISPSCTTPELSEVSSHPRILRTIPSDDFTAVTIFQLLQTLPLDNRAPINIDGSDTLTTYSKVVVLYQEDSYGSKYKDALFEIDQTDIEFVFIPFIPEDPESINSAVLAAAETKINIFVGLFIVGSLKFVAQSAFEQGIIGPERLWIFSDGVLGGSEIKSELENFGIGSDVRDALNNNFMVQATARTQQNNLLIREFERTFLQEGSGYDINLFRDEFEAATADPGESNGIQLNVNEIQGDISEKALFAYDSILAVRHFIDSKLDAECNGDLDFRELPNFFKTEDPNFSFPGLTGNVDFSDEGTRTEQSSFAKLVRLDLGNGRNIDCGLNENDMWSYIDDAIVFNGGSLRAPRMVDAPEQVTLIGMDSAIQSAMFATGAVILFIVALLFAFVYKSRNRNVIKAAQPLFLCIMLVGVVISTSSVFFSRDVGTDERTTGDTSATNCNAPFILISLGLTITFSALVFKLQRVATVANTTPELRDNKIYSVWDSLKLIFLVITVDIILILTAFFVNPLEFETTVSETDEFGQAIEQYELCVPNENGNGEIYGLLIGFHILFYLYAFRLVFKTKDMSTDFQEGKWIAFSVIAQFQLFALGIPVVIAVGTETNGIRYLIVSLIVHFSNVILLALVFVPKIYRVATGDDDIVWSDRNDQNSGFQHFSSYNKDDDSKNYRDVRKSLYNTMATQDFGHEPTL